MEPVLRQMILKRFRSIPAATIDFDNPTVLVGKNGSGKSNIKDALDFFAEAAFAPLHAVFDARGGIAAVRNKTSGTGYPANLGLGVVFDGLNGDVGSARYSFEIRATRNHGFEVLREQCVVRSAPGLPQWFDRSRGNFHTNVDGLRPALESASLALPVVGGDSRFSPVLKTLSAIRTYAIEPIKLREMQEPDSGLSLKSDGSNAASVLQVIARQSPEDMERIGEILTTIAPNTTHVRPIKHGNKLTLEFTQEWGQGKRLKLESFSMSDGTLRALGLLTAVYQRPRPAVMVIEEPEATIHAGAIGAILDLLRHASRGMQLIITTHSPDVLDAEWLQDRHIRIVDWEEGATRIVPLSRGSREALREHLMTAGELLRSNALRGAPVPPGLPPPANLFEDLAA